MQEAVIVESKSEHKATIIWLHGLGADGHDFEPIVPQLRLDDELGIRFIFPHAPIMPVTINGGMQMRAWYDIKSADLTQREDLATTKASAETIKRFIEAEIDSGIASEKIIIAGFSQGGAISLYTGLRFDKPLAGILALSTYLPIKDSTESELHENNKSTPIMQMHGQFDPIIPMTTAKQSFDYMKQLGLDIEWKDYRMEHSVAPEQIRDITEWIIKILG